MSVKWLPMALFAIGLGACLAWYWAVGQPSGHWQVDEQVASQCTTTSSLLQTKWTMYLTVAELFMARISAANMTRAQIQQLGTSDIFYQDGSFTGLGSVSYAQFVQNGSDGSARRAFEQSWNPTTTVPLTLTQFNASSNVLVARSAAEDYFVVSLDVTKGQVLLDDTPYGFDLASSNPQARSLLQQVTDGGIPLFLEGSALIPFRNVGSVGLNVLMPLYLNISNSSSSSSSSTSDVSSGASRIRLDPQSLSLAERRLFLHGVLLLTIDCASMVAMAFSSSIAQDVIVSQPAFCSSSSSSSSSSVQLSTNSSVLALAVSCSAGSVLLNWRSAMGNTAGLELALGVLCTFFVAVLLYLALSARAALAHEYQKRELAETNMVLATKSKEEFLSFVCHELRNPLHAVLGMTELLQHMPLPQEAKDLGSTMATCSAQMSAIINDMLDLRDMEVDQMKIEESAFDVRKLVQDVFHMFQFAAEKKGIEFRISVDPRIPLTMMTDPNRLRQILLHLVSNALKFTTEGIVHLIMSVQTGDDSQRDAVFDEQWLSSDAKKGSSPEMTPGRKIFETPSFGVGKQPARNGQLPLPLRDKFLSEHPKTLPILFSLSDTGVGIDQETISILFRPYDLEFRNHSRDNRGIGLGLSLVNILVKKMGGLLQIKSTVGKGSEFSFVLVMRRTEARPESPAPRPYSPNEHFAAAIAKARYLRHMGSGPSARAPPSKDRFDRLSIQSVNQTNTPEITSCDSPVSRSLHRSSVPNRHISVRQQRSSLRSHIPLMLPSRPIPENSSDPKRHEFSPVSPRESSFLRSLPSQVNIPTHVHALFVDDELINRKVANQNLVRAGFRVDQAVDGLDALEKVYPVNPEFSPSQGSTPAMAYDIIFMDLNMPRMDGIQATTELRKRGYPGPIVAITANAFAKEDPATLAAGFNEIFIKPVKPKMLVKIVQKFCKSADSPM